MCALLEARMSFEIFFENQRGVTSANVQPFSATEISVFPHKSYLSWNLEIHVVPPKEDLKYRSPAMMPIC